MADENAPLPLRAVPGIPRRRAEWSLYTRIALHSFETALRVLPDTQGAAGSPHSSRDYDRVIAAMFRVLRRSYQDAAPYAPPGGEYPLHFPAGRSFRYGTPGRRERDSAPGLNRSRAPAGRPGAEFPLPGGTPPQPTEQHHTCRTSHPSEKDTP